MSEAAAVPGSILSMLNVWACSADCQRHLQPACAGFQFNHVGGGTKTRRPITLHMKYNSSAVQPTCFLLTEDCGEQEVSLEELQVRRGSWQQDRRQLQRAPQRTGGASERRMRNSLAWPQCRGAAAGRPHSSLRNALGGLRSALVGRQLSIYHAHSQLLCL